VSYLLDTNVISELARPQPDSSISAWFASVPDETLHLSVLTLGEIRKGVERLPASRKRERLRLWLEHDLPDWFAERLLPIDMEVADRWGRLLAETGRPLPAIDSLLAATALHHGLRFVTRNANDFAFPGLEVVDPWTA
jgi:predicted nucleic acid-binding protein